MTGVPTSAAAGTAGTGSRGWYRDLTRLHWFVLIVASLGWLFDTMDQQLFNLARRPAIAELLRSDSSSGAAPGASTIAEYAGYTTMIFMIGWATGGVFFGILGDRLGRVKTMLITILCYSMFTGLSASSVGVWDFTFYRFITGLGVGGQFAVGVALVAESVSDRARPFALGWLQAASTWGNMLAAGVGIGLGSLEQSGVIASAWRTMFVVGALPAFLCLFIMRRLKEPERWQQTARAGLRRGSVGELFSDPRWRRNAIVGMLLAFSGVVGLWGIGFFSVDLLRSVLDKTDMSAGQKTFWTSMTLLLQNMGGFLGIYAFTHLTHRIGRRRTFAIAFTAAMFSTAYTFWNLKTFTDIFWMVPIMGACQLSLFGGYAIYLPELFPTRLRSTGTSFCYNVGRFVAALGPLALGLLTSRVFVAHAEPMRYAGVSMCVVFLIGLATLPFAPETKGRPLPE
ncbi:MAG: MFS transporter [Vicinamibacterales bacterium]